MQNSRCWGCIKIRANQDMLCSHNKKRTIHKCIYTCNAVHIHFTLALFKQEKNTLIKLFSSLLSLLWENKERLMRSLCCLRLCVFSPNSWSQRLGKHVPAATNTQTTIEEPKSTIFWNITPCSPLSVNRRFGGKYRLYLQGRKISWARNQRESTSICSSETSVDTQSQKMVLFITTAVRISNLTIEELLCASFYMRSMSY
jgi:hypothetical protein